MNIPIWIKSAGIAAKAFAVANAPTILFVGGLAVGVVAIAHAIKDSITKDSTVVEEAIDDIHAANETLKECEPEARPEAKRAKRKALGRFLKTCIKLYGKTLALALIAASLMAGGFYWQSKRFAIASAAAASSAAIINTVDNNIRSLWGEDGVIAMHDPNFDAEAFKEKAAANGNTEAIEAINKQFEEHKPSGIIVPGDWIFKFDEYNVLPGFWHDNPVQNIHTLIMVQNFLTQKLANGDLPYLTVNDALKNLGFAETEFTPAGLAFGWGPRDFVDFGLGEAMARIQLIYDGKELGQSRSDIWRKYGDQIMLHFEGVKYLGNYLGGKELTV